MGYLFTIVDFKVHFYVYNLNQSDNCISSITQIIILSNKSLCYYVWITWIV